MSEHELEAPPAQTVRKFRTQGGGVAVWTWDPHYIKQGWLRHWGTLDCSGCKGNHDGYEWYDANKHAQNCHQIP